MQLKNDKKRFYSILMVGFGKTKVARQEEKTKKEMSMSIIQSLQSFNIYEDENLKSIKFNFLPIYDQRY